MVSFLGLFYRSIDISSLPRPFKGDEWRASDAIGDTLSARIVLVDQASKSIRLSLRPLMLQMRAPLHLSALGEFYRIASYHIESCRIGR